MDGVLERIDEDEEQKTDQSVLSEPEDGANTAEKQHLEGGANQQAFGSSAKQNNMNMSGGEDDEEHLT
jgi:hypothetical protein